MKDKFWNFLFYKFIFVFGVMNVQTMEEVVWWVGWFTVLGFFQLLTQLSKDRFEYVSYQLLNIDFKVCCRNLKVSALIAFSILYWLLQKS